MTYEVTEGAIVLELQATRCLKWDDHAAFANGVKRLGQTKAVDICAVVDGEGAVFLELKDFRAAAIENAERLESGALALEVAHKVRDSLAGLVWAADRGFGDGFDGRLVRAFLEKPKACVVLWLEEDRVPDDGRVNILVTAIRSALKPHIEARVVVTSTLLEKQTKTPLTWLRARGLPSTRIAQRPR